MPDETRHESEDLQDYQVQDSTDTLSGAPGDDPLDRGVVPPERWSAGVRFGDTATEQSEGESLDQLLCRGGARPRPRLRRRRRRGRGPRGRTTTRGTRTWTACSWTTAPTPGPALVAEDEGAHPDEEEDLVARDVGIDAGGATAEEAAMHVVEEDDYDIRSE